MSGDEARLRWGVKHSLIDYVLGVYDGAIEASDGATREPDATFVFEPDPAGDEDGVRRFRGRVRITAYDGQMHIELADPWVESDGDAGPTLTVFSELDGRRIPMARLAPREDGWSATLTTLGADVLGPQYAPGAEIDPVRIG